MEDRRKYILTLWPGAELFDTGLEVVATVTVSPATASVNDGDTQQLTAVVRDSNGSALAGRTIVWSSSDASKVSVNSSTGLATGVGVGAATITATVAGKTGTAVLTGVSVTPAPAAWWKADALALADGDDVTSWPDSSAGGFTLTPGTAPTFSTAHFTPGAVRFTAASTQYLQNATFTALNALAGFTVFAVFDELTEGNAFLFDPANTAGRIQYYGGQDLHSYVSAGNEGFYTSADAPSKHIHEFVFDGSQATNAARLVVLAEGVAKTQSFNGTIPATTATATGLDVGVQNGLLGSPFDGEIAEILVYASALSSTQRTTIRVALGAKWSITVTP